MRPWDWIVLAAIAEGTLALVLAVLVQRRTRYGAGTERRSLEDPELQVALEHQVVVENYRIAHRLAEGGRRANTEQLRLAMLHYRVVLEELLEEPPFDLE